MRFLIKEYQDAVVYHRHKLMVKKKDLSKVKKEILWKEKNNDGFNNFYEYSFPNYIKIISILVDEDSSAISFEICSYKSCIIWKNFSYNSNCKNPHDWRDDNYAKKSFEKKIKKLENAGYIYV